MCFLLQYLGVFNEQIATMWNNALFNGIRNLIRILSKFFFKLLCENQTIGEGNGLIVEAVIIF